MYEIQLQGKDTLWHTLPLLCDGLSSTAVTETKCSFEMLEVTESPLLLVQGDLIVAKVRAGNDIGWGEYSTPNTVG